MELFAWLASAFIGISLGLIGGGGSILTVPVLVYLFGVNPLLATSYSLFVVGSTSMVGAFDNYRGGNVNVKIALLFGLSSITTVFILRKLLIPHIPKTIMLIGQRPLTEGVVTMTLFALLMITAAIAMIKAEPIPTGAVHVQRSINWLKLLLFGAGIGLATGLLGAGGGFLLIPTLVLFVGLPMKDAVGTSLLIIALNSLIGFTGDLGHFTIEWPFLLKVTAIAMAGVFIGGFIARKVDGTKLKAGFGWFVLMMGLYILVKETMVFLSNG